MSTTQLESINPYSGEIVRTFTAWSDGEVEDHIRQSETAFQAWKKLPVDERAAFIRQLANLLTLDRETFAGIITNEMGKPIAQSRAEIDKCVWLCEYYADQAAGLLRVQEKELDGKKAWIRPEPMGGILGIMPWNYPFWQVFRFAVPAILAGNTALLKPAPNVMGCGEAIAFLFSEALPISDVFLSFPIEVDQVELLIRNPFVRGVAFTGSTRAGAEVAALAGKYRKKTILELGGSDPFLVLADADLEAAAMGAINSRLGNNGQACIAAKRFIVDQQVYEPFLNHLVNELQHWNLGNPWEETTTLSTLAREDLKELLLSQVEQSIEKGAYVYYNGNSGPSPAYGVAPLVLTKIPESAPAYSEELFGPVFSVFEVNGEEEAVALANSTAFGLGASIWTQDQEKAMRIAARLEVGTVAINQMVSSDPRLPFGGTKDSGYGRELGPEGVMEWVNLKTVIA